jgi:hypothetical protein
MQITPEFADVVLWEMRFIRWTLVALFVAGLALVVLLFAFQRSLSQIGARLKDNGSERQLHEEIEDLLAKGSPLDAKFLALDWVNRRPGYAYAHWFLAQSHYRLGELVEAKKAFLSVLSLAPNWDSAVTPWLARVEDEIAAAGPKAIN